MSSVEWVVADIFLVTDSGQGKIEPRHHPLKYSSDISMGIDTIWGMWKCHAKKMWMYVGLWLSFVFSLSYQRLCACAYLHVQRISVVCLWLSQDWRQVRNKRERVNALSSPTFLWVFHHLTHFGAGHSFWNTCIELHHKDQAAALYISYNLLGQW